MLLLIPTVLALTLGLIKGGSLRNLATLPMRGQYFIIISLLIQLLLYTSALRSSAFIISTSGAIYMVALGFALVGAVMNWHLGIAVHIATLGLALNTLVILVNGGHMPVNGAAMLHVQGATKIHEIANPHLYGNTRLANASSQLIIFSDTIPIRMPNGFGNVYSIGDTLIAAGIAILTYRATLRGIE